MVVSLFVDVVVVDCCCSLFCFGLFALVLLWFSDVVVDSGVVCIFMFVMCFSYLC